MRSRMRGQIWIVVLLVLLILISVAGFLRTQASNRKRERLDGEWKATKTRVIELEERVKKEQERQAKNP